MTLSKTPDVDELFEPEPDDQGLLIQDSDDSDEDSLCAPWDLAWSEDEDLSGD
jgi:hypothetical protein